MILLAYGRGVARILSIGGGGGGGLDSVHEARKNFSPWPRPLIRIM